MANSMPWSVRGIDPDIREQAVEAAHRSGMSVGQWLNQVLAGSIDDEDADELPPPRQRRAGGRRPDRFPDERIADIGDRLGRLNPRRASTAAHRFAQDDDSPVLDLLQEAVEAIERIERRQVAPAASRRETRGIEPANSALAEQIRALEARVERAMSQPKSTTPASSEAGLEQRLSGIMAALERMQAQIVTPVLSGGHSAQPHLDDGDPAFTRTLAEIEARRRQLDTDLTPRARARNEAEAPRPAAPDSALSGMRAELAQLTQRIDALRHDQGSLDEVAAVRRELAQVSSTLEQISPQRLVGLVEHAVSGLADRLVREPHAGLPTMLAEPLERVHEDVRAVLREVSNARGTDLLTREVGNIARRLDQISAASSPDQIERIAAETAAIKQLVGQALRSQPLEGLAHQIDQLSRQVERFQTNPAARDDRAMLDAIRDVSDRLERLDPRASFAGLESRLGAISTLEHRLSAIAGIEEKLSELALGVEKLAKKQQPIPKLDSISERLERIDRALDNPKSSPLAGLDQLTARLDKIGSQLDQVSSGPAKGQDDALLSLMERLSQRMEQVAGGKQDSHALDQLQNEIAGLARRVETVGGAPAGLDNIERAVSDLFAQIDLTRRDMREIAETTATRAAEQALQGGSGTRAPSENESLAAEGLLLLKRDLNDFKSAQGEAEARTRETLQQVQSTLSLMMKRLGDAEDKARHAPAAAAPMNAAPPPKPDFTNRIEAAARAEGSGRSDFMADRPAAQASSGKLLAEGLDLPLEPGMEPGMPASPTASLTASLLPDAPSQLDPRANFIAAARRAAQAAADKSQAALNDAPEAGKARPLASRVGAKGTSSVAFIARARKPILLGLAAIVFSMGALKVMNSRQAPVIPPSAKPSNLQTQELGGPNSMDPAKGNEVESTGAIEGTQSTADSQAMPGVKAPSIGDAQFNTRLPKRGQRLGDTSALSQTDPTTVGSLGQDGVSRPIDTSRKALADLAAKTSFKGMESLRDSALSGDVSSIFEIGSRFADGRGVTRDPETAARWFEQAATQGHAPSQYRLASLYREGRGIAKDASLAFQWFDRAAAQGHVLAMHNAAVLLAEGVHGSPDYAGAALWFKRAAEYGIKDSQFNIGILYARGLGVNQDLGESYRWFSIAANQGDIDAGKKRDDMAARLNKEQLSAEMEKVKTFKPKKPEAAANEVPTRDAVARRG